MESKKFIRAILSGTVDLSAIKSQKGAVYVLNEKSGKYADSFGKEYDYDAICAKIIDAAGLISAIEIVESSGAISSIELLPISVADIVATMIIT